MKPFVHPLDPAYDDRQDDYTDEERLDAEQRQAEEFYENGGGR